MEEEIKKVVYNEFSNLVDNIENDFKANYVRKRYNFLLSQIDRNLLFAKL